MINIRAAAICLSALICVNANADRTSDALLSKLLVLYPNTQFNSVAKSEIAGLYEVTMGRNVAYTDTNARYFLFGHLFDMSSQVDLTAQRRPSVGSLNKPDQMSWPQAELSQAIKTVRGTGERKIAVFSDPDCGFCRRLEAHLQQVDNVTIYTFMYPMQQLHPEAKSKSISVWCAPDPSTAWQDLMLGGKPPTLATCINPIEQNIVLARRLGVRGTPTMLNEQGEALLGAASAREIEAWLSGEQP